jgi:CHAT domain-containing protein
VFLRIEPASIDSLNQVMLFRPKVVHLSCHGDYDKQIEQYYLAFENKKELGLLDKLSTSRLNIILESNKLSNAIEVVLVSACHS